MNKKLQKIILFLSLAGLVLSVLLLAQHYQFKKGIQIDSFCSINEYIDCNRVNASHYAEIAGIPIAAPAVLLYLLIIIYTASALSSQKRGGFYFCFYLVAAAFLFSARMAYISLFQIKALCLFCTGLYLINTLLLILFPPAMGVGWKRLIPATREALKGKWGRHLLFTAAFFGGGVLIFNQIGKTASLPDPKKKEATAETDKSLPPGELTLEKIVELHFEQPEVDIEPGNRPFWGKKNASVMVIEFSDFECPYCKRAAEYLKPTLTEYKDDIAFYFVNYPLDKSCNPQMRHDMHKRACAAAMAAICAGQQNQFWPYHDLLFQDQKNLTDESLLDRAAKLQMDTATFKQCLGSREAGEILAEDVKLGIDTEIGGTPSVFVNGRHLRAWSNPEILKAIVEEEIENN